MDLFTRDDLKTLVAEHPSPCISLFMPTHRGGAEEDPIRWRKHLAEAEERLAKAGWRTAEVKEFLAPGRRLLDDVTFWKNQSDGLAVFLAPQFLCLFRLPLAFKDLVVGANRFSIIPLLPLISSNGRFYVLALSQHGVRLLQGTRDCVSEVDLKGVPRSLAEALLTHEAKEPFSFYGRRAGQGAGSWGGIFHGHGVGIDDSKEEVLHYFQKIDRGLHPLLSEERAPLVLAAVDYLQPIYRKANTYAHLLEEGVAGNPDRLNSKELHGRAWPLVKPLFETAQQRAAAQYRQVAGTGHASCDLEAIVAAACQGRVETLFVALDRQVWGVFDPSTGRVEQHEQPLFGDVDLLDHAAAHTLAHGRTVYAVQAEQVPSGTDVAAIFCHPLPKHRKRP
jgi:hypothetical protein